ncbi:MAG TPA: hypothetical protein VFE05_15850 [Longimicrobiaceae bacterium]|nr:hypothetical protein [Longimicrobiaceae bacterium]
MTEGFRAASRLLAAFFAAPLLLAPARAAAQLRPLEPVEWRVFQGANAFSVEVGGAAFRDQRASLAGTEGDLIEAANFTVAWRTGRISLEAAGTGQRFFRDRRRYAAPDPDGHVDPSIGPRRHDSGDYRISTAVRLTPDASRVAALLRFGTRLPTTDNMTGLDRDATDFFATVGARGTRGPLALSAEAGLTIVGTRRADFEQDDLLVYAVRAEYAGGPVTPTLTVLGQQSGSEHRQIRGNENLGEARLGLRAGTRRTLRVELVRGYTPVSPSTGVIVAVGTVR